MENLDPEPPRGTITLVFTDIESSSELSERYGAAFEPHRIRHFTLLRDIARRYAGYEVNTAGDAIFLAFSDAQNALFWSVEAQRTLQAQSWTPIEEGIRVRIGLHTGEPYRIREPDGRTNYFGPAVNRAARIASAAHGGQILLSESTRILLHPTLAESDAKVRDLGKHRLKGVGLETLYQVVAKDLHETFPPPATLSPDRHNLPLSEGAFLGREAELAELTALLLSADCPRLVTLTAFGGMGKTRTARQVAENCVGEEVAFPGGVWWASLEEARTIDTVLRTISESLQIPMQSETGTNMAGNRVGSPTEQIHQYLRDRPRFLLILDNLEQIPDTASVVRDLLAQVPNIVCLATSRRPVGLKVEKVYTIQPLTQQDAIALFIDRARTVRNDFAETEANRDDIVALCRNLEFVPLAIELAAARASAMTPRQIRERLTEPLRLLQSRAPDLPARQRAIQATVDWSYDLLEDEERIVFDSLSAFAGPFSLEDAEAICTDVFSAFDSVLLLAEHSLLMTLLDAKTQTMRYHMLSTIRTYAAGKLSSTPIRQVAVWGYHGKHVLSLAQTYLARLRTVDEPEALQALSAVTSELRVARERSQVLPDGTQLHLDLSDTLGTALQERGFLSEAAPPIEDAITDARKLGNPLLLLPLLLKRAGLYCDNSATTESRTRETESARDLATEAFEIAEELSDAGAVANAKKLLALIAFQEKEYIVATELFREVLMMYQRVGEEHEIARIQNNIGMIAFHHADADRHEAISLLKSALETYQKLSDTRGMSKALNNLGNLAFAAQDWNHAERSYSKSLEINRILGDPHYMAVQLNNMGEVKEAQQQYASAARFYVAAETLFQNLRHTNATYTATLLKAMVDNGSIPLSEIALLRNSLNSKTNAEVYAWAVE